MNQVHKYHQSGISPCRGRAHINGAMTLLECPSGVLFGVCVCVCVCVWMYGCVCPCVCIVFPPGPSTWTGLQGRSETSLSKTY